MLDSATVERLRYLYDQRGGVLNDEMIQALVGIDPFVEKCPSTHPDGSGVISYGLSAYGYDLRVGDEYKIFHNLHNRVVDPKNIDTKCFMDFKGPVCEIPPNSFALAASVERLRIPRGVITVCVGKSTYARCGVIVNVTPLEPEWQGRVTLEISNTTPNPCRIYSNEGICQAIFLRGIQDCLVSYKDKKGKYQDQQGLTLPFVRRLCGPSKSE